MTVRVAHLKVSSVPDSDDTTLVRPSDWNEDHVVEGLGTAAESDTGDFATAAQGALADTAVQPAAIANMLETSDIGVSVQAHSSVLDNTTASFTTADETKLDGIEAGADVSPPDVFDYGASGSPTDDAVAFQAAGDGGEFVLVPAGSYVLGGDITPTDGAFFFAPNAVLDDYSTIKPRGFWADEDNGANIWRFRDRVMVGQAVYHDGKFTLDQDTWLGLAAGDGGAGYHWLERSAQMHVAHDRGGTAILGTGRTSDKSGMVGQTLIGLASYVWADDVVGSAWGSYIEAVRGSGVDTNVFGMELTAKNLGTSAGNSAYNIFVAGSTIGLWLGAGGDGSISPAAANPSTAAIVIGANGERWLKGIVFEDVGLEGTDGTGTGTAVAMELARGQEIVWRHSSTEADTSGRIRSDNNSASAETRIVFDSTGLLLRCMSTGSELTMAQFIPVSGATGHLTVAGGASTGVKINTDGSATNMDLIIGAKGTGAVYFDKNDAFNSSVVRATIMRHQTSGTPANGIGTGIGFQVETATGNNVEQAAFLDVLATDVTAASEDFDMRFMLMAGGAAAVEMMRLTSTGYLFAGPTAASEGVVAAKQIATVQGSAVALTNNITTAQSLFASANDALTALAATTYRFKGKFFVNTGTTTHTTAFGFGGTATATSIRYQAKLWSGTSGTINTTAPSVVDHNALTAKVLNATSGAAFTLIEVEGIVRVNAGGTLIPQITFSAGPTGTCEVAVDSFMELAPIGTNTVAAVGAWA